MATMLAQGVLSSLYVVMLVWPEYWCYVSDELFKVHKLKPSQSWRHHFDNYLKTIPVYYAAVSAYTVSLAVVMMHCTVYHTVSPKNVYDIFDSNLKTNYQILIVIGTNIPDTAWHQMTV